MKKMYQTAGKAVLLLFALAVMFAVSAGTVSAAAKTSGTAKVVDGKTYIYTQNGTLVKNKAVYKAGSRYYRIDKEGAAVPFKGVAAMAAERVLSKKINGNLKKAFKWAAMEFNPVAPCKSSKESKIAEYYGKYGFKHKRGDCYVQAYTFYWMAKVLGYDVKVIRGSYAQKSGTRASHAWCEIRDKKGRIYVYDPNFNKEYSAKLGNANAGYRIRYGEKQTLNYVK